MVDPEPPHARFRGRLAIPYHTPDGVVAMRFRCLEDHDCKEQARLDKEAEKKYPHRKYDTEAGAVGHIYNIGALHERHPAIAIAEGEFDAEVCDSFVLPTVGLAGANLWKPFYHLLFDDYERVFVIGDGDDPGKEYARTVAKKLDNGMAIFMPDGLDVNSAYLELGEEELRRLILGDDSKA